LPSLISQIHVFVLTKNEAPNIGRVLEKLGRFARVIVLDSGSTDATREIACTFPNVDWQERAFDNATNQCNYVLEKLLSGCEWVLSLDADYVLSDALLEELETLQPADFNAFEARFVFCMDGHALPGSFYPPRTVLFKPKFAHYEQFGHTQRLSVQGPVGQLRGKILHDDRKDFAYVLRNQKRYAAMESVYLRETAFSKLSFPGRLRKTGMIMPLLAPIVALCSKGSFLHGRPAWKYAYFRWIAELEIAKAIWRLRIS
jgi:glycosyltransferase involved in cell wall biosynthesis